MYAVIATGGKQYRVSEGQKLAVELLGEEGSSVDLRPVLVVDGSTVLSTPDELKDASVSATVLGQMKSTKINGFVYKSKTNNRRRYGHRQNLSTIEITSIKGA